MYTYTTRHDNAKPLPVLHVEPVDQYGFCRCLLGDKIWNLHQSTIIIDDETKKQIQIRDITSKSHYADVPDLMSNIREFHDRFELTYSGGPRKLPADLHAFRIGFIAEEYAELINAKSAEDELDAVVDLTYVLLGYCYLRGWDFDTAWRRVHAANMKKIRAVIKEDSKRGTTWDVVKPEGWTAPDLSDLVQEEELNWPEVESGFQRSLNRLVLNKVPDYQKTIDTKFRPLWTRYESGERTVELYNSMANV